MEHNRLALVELFRDLDAAPPPQGFLARWRRRQESRRLEAALEWHDIRSQGVAALAPARRRAVGGFALMWFGANVLPTLFSPRPFSIGRLALGLVLTAVPLGLLILYIYRLPPRIWREQENGYAALLQRALARRPVALAGSDDAAG